MKVSKDAEGWFTPGQPQDPEHAGPNRKAIILYSKATRKLSLKEIQTREKFHSRSSSLQHDLQ